jgi:predicted metalloendopeptidase
VHQYSQFTVPGPEPDSKPLHVNGRLTLGENIADAGGLKAAFEAWKKREEVSPGAMLPGLDSFSKEQLFFISYSTFWCSKTRKEAAIRRIYSDPHAPKPVRILVLIHPLAVYLPIPFHSRTLRVMVANLHYLFSSGNIGQFSRIQSGV